MLCGFPADPPHEGPPRDLPEVLELTYQTLRGLGEEIDRLVPWSEAFVGSSLVVRLAKGAVDDVVGSLDLHLHRLKEPPTTVLAMVDRPVRVARDRLEALVALLPGHVRLASTMSAREQDLRARVRALPPRLRRRFHLGLVLGALFLLSVVLGALLLLVPSISRALGASELLSKYAPSSAGVVVVAVLFFTGFRLILGSVWLTRTISILPQFEEKRVHAARARLHRRENEVLDRLAPRSGPPERTDEDPAQRRSGPSEHGPGDA